MDEPSNVLELLVNAMYRAADGDALAQRLIVSIAQGYNDRIAALNRTDPVQAIRRLTESGLSAKEYGQ
jgi:hypothetical protein